MMRYLGKRCTMTWHQLMKPSVTITAADTASAHSTTQPTASMKADRNELSVAVYMNIDSLEHNLCFHSLVRIRRSYLSHRSMNNDKAVLSESLMYEQ